MKKAVPRKLIMADMVVIKGRSHVAMKTADHKTFCLIDFPEAFVIVHNMSVEKIDCGECREWFSNETARS